ncbi:MAG: tRNA (adenosine(37)-N6)-dimethylallyltransferase MiaA [Prevotella sp.]|nr:tRNA (adenosine(37)-N6)-dimethylallyltransferase MiaA [Prevotella sp.]
MSKTLFVILGPTGVGKTELSLEIARRLSVSIINADSRQIYAELPIGTAAPTEEQQKRIKHYFVGNHHLQDYYSASMYEEDVMNLLNEQFQTNDYALLTGGSMMYIDAVCKGLDDIPTVKDEIRELYKQRLQAEGLPKLLEELKEVDPEHYNIVDHNNPRRVVHALEICKQTGKTFTSFRTNIKKERPFNIVKIGLNRPREEMYERINNRVIEMMKEGMLNEAKEVYKYKGLNSLNTVGYKELFAFFDGTIPYEEAVRQIQSNTRRYMRKQLTWFKRDAEITWFNPEEAEKILEFVDTIVSSNMPQE